MIWLIPRKKQWNAWSLPSKLTAIGAYAGIAGLLVTAAAFVLTQEHEVLHPELQLQLRLRIGGFQIRVVNASKAPAKQVTVSLKTWQIGAPGPDVRTEFPVRDMAPMDEYIFDVDLIQLIGDEKYDNQRLTRATSGYFAVRSIDSKKPRAWAFFVPGQGSDLDSHFYEKDLWPTIEFDYPEEIPQRSLCVDYPTGICKQAGKVKWKWSPQTKHDQL